MPEADATRETLESQDLYAILGVARDAERDDIRKAYRKLARQNHPDLNPGDDAAEERFKHISKAWDVLQDDEKRRNYDEFGEVSLDAGFDADKAREAREAFGAHFGFAGDPRSGPFQGGAHSQEFHFGDLDDLLGGVFGREGRGRGREQAMRFRGPDLHAILELDFLEAARGGEKQLSLGRPTPEGGVAQESVTVRIPPGVASGGELRVPGKGAPGMGGGPPGDLRVELRVRPHRVFRREGRNLLIDVPLSVREATLGAKVEIPTLDGRVTLTVPPGTDSGSKLRLRGKGIPHPRGGAPGDLLARVEIRVPRDLGDEARAALEALDLGADANLRKELFE